MTSPAVSPVPEEGRGRCGYTIVDRDGEEQPCDRAATGWRWYQNVEHEDLLDVACGLHENEGGRRMHEAESALARVTAERDEARRQVAVPAVAGREAEPMVEAPAITGLLNFVGVEGTAFVPVEREDSNDALDELVAAYVAAAQACLRAFEAYPLLRDGAVARELRAALAARPTAEPAEPDEPDYSELLDKWERASKAARKLEHHWTADCLAEAVDVARGMDARIKQQNFERRYFLDSKITNQRSALAILNRELESLRPAPGMRPNPNLTVFDTYVGQPEDLLSRWLDDVDQLVCALGGEPIGFTSNDEHSGLSFATIVVATLPGDSESTLLCEDCAGWLEDVFAPSVPVEPTEQETQR